MQRVSGPIRSWAWFLGMGFLLAMGCDRPDESIVQKRQAVAASGEGKGALRFSLEGSDRAQTVEVSEAGDGQIEVSIALGGSCRRSIAGIAKASFQNADSDIEEDSNGEGWPVDTYLLKQPDGCTVSIGIALDDSEFVWLREGGCEHKCRLSPEAMSKLE